MLRAGSKARGYELLGTRFYDWLYSRRFQEMDLSELDYRAYKADGVSKGIFADPEKARDMVVAPSIFCHTDDLRLDCVSLPNCHEQIQRASIAAILRTPYGVSSGELPPLPTLDPNTPTVINVEEVSAMRIWIVEPDAAHRHHTYCMAYLRP